MIETVNNIIFTEDFGRLVSLIEGRRAFAVVDANLKHLKPESVFGPDVIYIEATEQAKTLRSIEQLAVRLLDMGADRNSILVGIGGGVTTDIAGFLASVFMRGIDFGAVPTTTLSQVDAAIGGKNGVNLDGYKNILGTFSSPEFIMVCPGIAATEPEESRLCGITEMLKTFIISDRASYFGSVEKLKRGGGTAEYVKRASLIKCEVTERDPIDKGERRLLNLGHTFGHAIEKCSGGTIPHGKAVAQGILMAASISCNLGTMPEEDRETLRKDFAELNLLPSRCNVADLNLIGAVKMDKKRDGRDIMLVLPERIGKAEVRRMSVEEIKRNLVL